MYQLMRYQEMRDKSLGNSREWKKRVQPEHCFLLPWLVILWHCKRLMLWDCTSLTGWLIAIQLQKGNSSGRLLKVRKGLSESASMSHKLLSSDEGTG
jgi:hypothetical protein